MIGETDTNRPFASRLRQPKPPSETENKIFALLKSIPALKPDISEMQFRHYANYLNGVVVMAHMNHQRPETRRVGAKRTQAELDKLSDLAEEMTIEMNSAHRETNELIRAALPKGSSLSQYKNVMQQAFRVLHQASVDAGELTEKGKKPSDKFAAEVDRAAAEAFTALTGRKAVPIVRQIEAGYRGTKAQSSGPYLDFLATLFKALGIEASAEYHARLRINRA
jgi:hypothetical protein